LLRRLAFSSPQRSSTLPSQLPRRQHHQHQHAPFGTHTFTSLTKPHSFPSSGLLPQMTHVDPFRLAVPSRRHVCTYGVRSPRDRTRRLAPKLVGLGLVRLGGKERGAGGWTTSSSAAAAAAMSSSQLPLLSRPQISSPFVHPSRPYSSQPSNLSPSSSSSQQPTSTIKSLMRSPLLFSPSPTSTSPSSSPSESRPPGFPPPKHTIVLCHGLYGYGVRGKPGGEIHYWAHVHEVLVGCGAEVLVVEVPR
jgi:hypothetical protein